MPSLVEKCYPDLERVLQIATPIEQEQVEKMGIDDLVEVLSAIIEVNNFAGVYEKIKKMIPRKAVEAPKV